MVQVQKGLRLRGDCTMQANEDDQLTLLALPLPPPFQMLSRSLVSSSARSAKSAPMGARFASNLPIPPKVATPKSVQGPGGDSSRMESVVSFYKSLPKGAAPAKRGGGIKAR